MRRVNAQGKLVVDGATYTAGIAYAGQELAVQVDAAARELVLIQRERAVKLQRLLGGMMPFAQMVDALCGLADRETKRLNQRQQRRTKRRRS